MVGLEKIHERVLVTNSIVRPTALISQDQARNYGRLANTDNLVVSGGKFAIGVVG